MRGSDDQRSALSATVSTEDRIPVDHPIREIRTVVGAALDPVFLDVVPEDGWTEASKPALGAHW